MTRRRMKKLWNNLFIVFGAGLLGTLSFVLFIWLTEEGNNNEAFKVVPDSSRPEVQKVETPRKETNFGNNIIDKLFARDSIDSEFRDQPRKPDCIENDDKEPGKVYTDKNPLDYFQITKNDGMEIIWINNVNTKAYLLSSMLDIKIMMIEGDVSMGDTDDKKNLPVMTNPPATYSDVTLGYWVENICKYTNKGIKLDFRNTECLQPSFEVLVNLHHKIHAPLFLHADIIAGPNAQEATVDAAQFISQTINYFPHSTISLGWHSFYGNKYPVKEYSWAMVIAMAKYCTRITQSVTFAVRAVYAGTSVKKFRWLLSLSERFTITIWSDTYDIVSLTQLKNFRRYIDRSRVFYDVPESFFPELRNVGKEKLVNLPSKVQSNLWQPLPLDPDSYVFPGLELTVFTGKNSWMMTKQTYQAEYEHGKLIEVTGKVFFQQPNQSLQIFFRGSAVDSLSALPTAKGICFEIFEDGTLKIYPRNMRAGVYRQQTSAVLSRYNCYYFVITDRGEKEPMTMEVGWASDCGDPRDGSLKEKTLEEMQNEKDTMGEKQMPIILSVNFPYENDFNGYVTVNGSSDEDAIIVEKLNIKTDK